MYASASLQWITKWCAVMTGYGHLDIGRRCVRKWEEALRTHYKGRIENWLNRMNSKQEGTESMASNEFRRM